MSSGKNSGWGVWKWIGCGCGGCLLAIVLVTVFIVAVGGLAVFGMSKSEAYQQALDRAQQDPAVVEALGEPIEPGLFPSGSISVTGPSGEADMAIPVSGPKGSGTLYVVAEKSAGEWTFSRLEVEIEGASRRVDLLAPPLLEARP